MQIQPGYGLFTPRASASSIVRPCEQINNFVRQPRQNANNILALIYNDTRPVGRHPRFTRR